jgi:hypothetical protein
MTEYFTPCSWSPFSLPPVESIAATLASGIVCAVNEVANKTAVNLVLHVIERLPLVKILHDRHSLDVGTQILFNVTNKAFGLGVRNLRSHRHDGAGYFEQAPEASRFQLICQFDNTLPQNFLPMEMYVRMVPGDGIGPNVCR